MSDLARPLSKKTKVFFSSSMDAALRAKLNAYCKANNIPITVVLDNALREYLAAQKWE